MTLGVVAFPGALDSVASLSDVTNGAQTVMASNGGSVSSGATTINVTSTSLFPSANGSLVIDSEIIYYTGTTATSFTGCLRGQNGTSAASHNDGSVVDCYILAAHFTLLRDLGIAISTKLGSGSSTPSAGLYLRGNGTGTSAWSSLSSSDIITGLGYTPMNPTAANTITAAGTALTVNNDVAVGGQLSVAGVIGLNGATVATSGVHIWGGVMSGSSQYGVELVPTCSSGAVTAFYGLFVSTTVGNISFTQDSNYGIYIANGAKGALATITNAYGLYIDPPTHGGSNYALYVAGGLVSLQGTLNVANNTQISGNLGLGVAPSASYGLYQLGGAARLSALNRTTVTVTAVGATTLVTWTYMVFAKDRNGNYSPAVSTGSVTNGVSTLNGSNYNAITWVSVPGAVSYDVVRTVTGISPNTTGSIALGVVGTSFNDTGVAASAYTQPTWNSTADLTLDGALYFGTTNQSTQATGDPATSPTAGGLWYSSTRKWHRFSSPLGPANLQGTLLSSWPASDSVTGTVSETAFATNYVIPAGSLVADKTFRITARGIYISTSTFTLQFALRLTNGATHIALATAVAAAVTTAASPGFVWTIDAYVTVTALGSGTSALANCYMRRAWTTTANTSTANETVVGVWRGNAIGFDSTIAQTLELTAKWSSTAPTVTLEYLEVTALD